MSETQPTKRAWFVELSPAEARLRCSYARRGRTVERFTVQLEISVGKDWVPIVRYDNAHGFCHRDTLHPDGTQDKTLVFVGDVNATFTFAIDDLRAHWEAHRAHFLGEIRP
jgi:hypothetical protein